MKSLFEFIKMDEKYISRIFGGLIGGDAEILADCSTTCRDGSACSVTNVSSCSTISNAGPGEVCITYTKKDGTTDTKTCPTNMSF